MKRTLASILCFLLVLCIALPAMAADGIPFGQDGYQPGTTNYTIHTEHEWSEWTVRQRPTCQEEGSEYRYCRVCQQPETRTIPKTDHIWGEWDVIQDPTCETEGEQIRYCTVCQKQDTQKIAKKGHSWGDWQVIKAATCQEEGSRKRTCSVCGKTETQTVAKSSEHSWSDWETVKEPTCTEKGQKRRICSVCGKTEYLRIKELGHEAESWTVTKEPTCQKTGTREGLCVRCGKKLTERMPRVDHAFSEWETVTEATLFSKGKRTSVCGFCKKKKTEEFYPEGTLARDLDNDPEEVKDFQLALKAEGFFTGTVTGTFDKATVSAVKKAEKEFGLDQDGIGWPGLRMLLGGKGGPGGMGGTGGPEDGISKDPSKFKLQLWVKRTSPGKDYYVAGDVITYEWTLKNASTKNPSKSTKMFFYLGTKFDSKKAEMIEDIGTLGKGDTTFGTYSYTVTKDDALKGIFRNSFIATGKLGSSAVKSNSVVFVHHATAGTGSPGGGWTPPSEENLTVTKTITNAPKNGIYFTKGEVIKFRIEVTNKGTTAVEDVIITDPVLGSSWKKSIGTLAPAESKVFDVEYTVTVKDLSGGEVVNTAIVSYRADGKTKVSKATVKAPVGMNTDGLFIYKTCTNLPKNGLFFVPGEIVEFQITIYNPTAKKTFTNLELFDWLYSKKHPYKTVSKLTPGAYVTFVYKTKVTELQAKKGKLTNSVMVSFKDPDKKKRTSLSNQCTVPCGPEGADGVIVTKKVISTPANGSYYVEGEEIRFQIDITNNTVKDILTMDVRDSLAAMDSKGYRTVQAGETLATGDTFTIHFSYIVTAADVENSKVVNIASAYWSVKTGEFWETYSDPVIVPTQPVISDRKPDNKNLAGEACTPTLTSVGDGIAQRDLTECVEHTETAKKAEQLITENRTAEAEQIWEAEIDQLYAEWQESNEGETKRTAENEQAAFEHQMSALEASLSLVCSEEDVQAIMTEERMEKCVNLCYELHTAPEERPDSLNAAAEGMQKGKTRIECSRAITYSAEGPARLVDDRCESHTLTTQLTETLLESAQDEEDRVYAWQRAQANWVLELDMMYDTWYLSASAEERPLIAADRISFDKLINARMESLEILYPDDPESAAEVLSNMIMHRTELICRVLHDAGVLTDED